MSLDGALEALEQPKADRETSDEATCADVSVEASTIRLCEFISPAEAELYLNDPAVNGGALGPFLTVAGASESIRNAAATRISDALHPPC